MFRVRECAIHPKRAVVEAPLYSGENQFGSAALGVPYGVLRLELSSLGELCGGLLYHKNGLKKTWYTSFCRTANEAHLDFLLEKTPVN